MEKCPCLHQVTFLWGGKRTPHLSTWKKIGKFHPWAQHLNFDCSSLLAPRKSAQEKLQLQQLPHLALLLAGKLLLQLPGLMCSLQKICSFSWQDPAQVPPHPSPPCSPPCLQPVPHSAPLLRWQMELPGAQRGAGPFKQCGFGCWVKFKIFLVVFFPLFCNRLYFSARGVTLWVRSTTRMGAGMNRRVNFDLEGCFHLDNKS